MSEIIRGEMGEGRNVGHCIKISTIYGSRILSPILVMGL